MSSTDTNKKYKRPKQNTFSTNPETLIQKRVTNDERQPSGPICPLLAKDSEWVDIVQTPASDGPASSTTITENESVECEDGLQMKPLAIMFPGILDKDPQTLQGILNKAISTTEVTRHLVDLGQKANFTFMKTSSRLISKDKKWLDSVMESSNSRCSLESHMFSRSISSEYDADNEIVEYELNNRKRRKKSRFEIVNIDTNTSSNDTLVANEEDRNVKNLCRKKKQ